MGGFNEKTVAITAADFGLVIKGVVNQRMTQGAVAAVTGNFVGMGGNSDCLRFCGHVYGLVTLCRV